MVVAGGDVRTAPLTEAAEAVVAVLEVELEAVAAPVAGLAIGSRMASAPVGKIDIQVFYCS